MKSGIYKITNTVNGKFYIGSSADIDKRWYDHKRELTLNVHTNPKLQHSWNKHGKDKFVFDVIEVVDSDQQKLFEREQYYLDTLKPYEREIGYNICPIAQGGDNITHNPNKDAFIERMQIVTSGENNGMFGKFHTTEAIQKQKDKAKGRYTIEWFIDRYGKRLGKRKFNERRMWLSNRPKECFSHPNPSKGIKRSPMTIDSKRKLTESKLRMKTQRQLLLNDIKSNKFTIIQLATKYNIGITAVKSYKQKMRKEEKKNLFDIYHTNLNQGLE